MLAITRKPAPNMHDCARTYVAHAPVDAALAHDQHAAYCRLLGQCGARVVTLAALPELPDSTFVEDTAIVLDEVAIIASMGIAARRDEPPHIEPMLREHRELVRVELPATIDGGDVLLVGRTLLVGQSCRTSGLAIAALAAIGKRFGYSVIPVPVRGCLHLKTACTALPDRRLLVNPTWIDTSPLGDFGMIEAPPAEPWAANTLLLGETVIIDAAHAETAKLIAGLGFRVERIELSEFAKAEGGVTCLCLLVP